jgi:RES domain-containing protein
MRVWRIGVDTADYGADDTSGTGARLTGGRWNPVGVAMLYCSDTPSLACLETLVHLGATGLPFNRYLVAIDIPDDVWSRRQVKESATLAVGWDAVPAGLVSIGIGGDWAKGGASAVLVVPSSIVPEDRVILINSLHLDAAGITAKKLRKWTYDPRLRTA